MFPDARDHSASLEGPWVRRTQVRVLTDEQSMLLWPQQAARPLRLSSTAQAIWEGIEYPITHFELCAQLASRFDQTADAISLAVAKFLSDLEARGLLAAEDTAPTGEEMARARYLRLLKRSLVNALYPEHELRVRFLHTGGEETDRATRARLLRDIAIRDSKNLAAIQRGKLVGSVAALHLGFAPHTLIGISGLENLERCVEQIVRDRIPGDFLEAGVLAGGASIFLRALQVAFAEGTRKVWVADSFEGLPPPSAAPDVESGLGLDLTEDRHPLLCADLGTVKENFSRYGLLDENVRFLKGWFADTLPSAPVEQLALLRIDADLYESTLDVLSALYERVSPGGFVVVDDYGAFAVCRQAVDEFRQTRGVTAPLIWVDADRVFWRTLR